MASLDAVRRRRRDAIVGSRRRAARRTERRMLAGLRLRRLVSAARHVARVIDTGLQRTGPPVEDGRSASQPSLVSHAGRVEGPSGAVALATVYIIRS